MRTAKIASVPSFIALLLMLFLPQNLMASENGLVLEKVENPYVCMMTNRAFPNEQIPVQIGDKTYYGCCPGCEAKLKSSEKERMAIDPVSGNAVDKATAVIGSDKSGAVYYFENEENLKNYTP